MLANLALDNGEKHSNQWGQCGIYDWSRLERYGFEQA